MKGIICVNKPKGCTSFDVVARLRKILNIKKVGHSGTLDPLATGVLPVFFGKATRAISFLQNTEKSYVAGFKLGYVTDTFDCCGSLIEQKISRVSENILKKELIRFKGVTYQVPPKYSAVKVGGVPAYERARRGEVFELKAKKIEIFDIDCLEFDTVTQSGRFAVHCSSGTYVRGICRDLGEALGVGCILTSLVRVMACGWTLQDCFSIEELEKLSFEGRIGEAVCGLETLFNSCERIELGCLDSKKFINGARVRLQNEVKGLIAVFFRGEFLGLARCVDGWLMVEKLFV